MKHKLTAGAEVDVLNKDELQEVLVPLLRELLDRDVEERVRGNENSALDPTGAAVVEVYGVPIGMLFRLTRVVVRVDGGSSFAAPYVNGAGSVEIRRNGRVVDGVNLSTGLPNVWTQSGAASPVYRNGEQVEVAIAGGPANGNVLVEIEGDLYPMRVVDRKGKQGA